VSAKQNFTWLQNWAALEFNLDSLSLSYGGLLCLSSSPTKDHIGPAAVTVSWHDPQSS
jgi:hypothetical protein